MLTGYTDRTSESLQLNAGVFLKNYTVGGSASIAKTDIIGATRGGGTFSAVPTIRQPAVDGAPTYVVGNEVIDDWVVTISVASFLEFTEGALKLALGGGASVTTQSRTVGSTTVTDTKITATRTVASTDSDNDSNTNGDFRDIWWVGDTGDGKKIAIHLKNCLNLTGLVATFSDRGEGTFPVTFTAHYAYDSSNANWAETAPFELFIEG